MATTPKPAAKGKAKPIRFSERTNWYLEELVRVGYGLNKSEVVRRFVWDGIKKAQLENDLPRKTASVSDIPDSLANDPDEGEDAEEEDA